MKTSSLIHGAILAATAQAQSTAWGQCGGQGWTGATTCVAGYTCTFSNAYYSQCLPGTGGSGSGTTTTLKTSTTASTTTLKTSTTTSSPTKSSSSAQPSGTGLRWIGADESCAEFGTAIPGTWGVDFTFPSVDTISTLITEGYNIFRMPFMMERMAPGSLTASLSPAYLANYSAVVNAVTAKGAYVVIDPHNYGRYNGAIITDTTGFGTFWKNLATQFKSNTKVIFDTNNEYNTMDESLVVSLNQAAITAIRSVGATSQYIFVEGNAWTGAWSWNTTNDAMKTLTDPQNMIIYEMHQYLDSDSSGTSATCVSSTIGVERVEGATAWLRNNGKLGILGEFAGGENAVCKSAVQGMLQHLHDNSDVWRGAAFWAAGPWWTNSQWSNFEPPNGVAYTYYDSVLKSFMS